MTLTAGRGDIVDHDGAGLSEWTQGQQFSDNGDVC